jgi:hypothetical protein
VPASPDQATPDGTRIAAALVPRCLSPRAVFRMVAFNPMADAANTTADTNPQPEQFEEQ